MQFRFCLFLSLIVTMACTAPVLAASDLSQADLSQADRMIREGKAKAAYNMLKPYEFERSGDVRFDYLLGLAALESGRPDEATLAFERVLIQNPNFLGARLDLARAWFALNLYDLAKEELQKLNEMNPPPSARKVIDRYLVLIEERTAVAGPGTTFSGYLEGRYGRDSNVNASPGNSTVYIPAFAGNITLNADSVGLADNYYGLAFGLNGAYRNSAGNSFLAGIEAVDKRLRKQTAFDTTDYKGMIGVSHQSDRSGYNIGIQYDQMMLNDLSYRKTTSFGFDTQWAFDPVSALFLFGQLVIQRYDGLVNNANDSDIILAGVGYAYAYGEDEKSSLYLSLYTGRDMAVRSRVDGDKNLIGLKGGISHAILPSLTGQLNAGYQHGAYDLSNALFQVGRRDQLIEAGAGLVWQFAKGWSFRPSVSYLQSNSNIAIYDYRRTDLSVALRYTF